MHKVLFSLAIVGLLLVSGCAKQDTQPAAEVEPAVTTEEHEVMKPVIPEETAVEEEAQKAETEETSPEG